MPMAYGDGTNSSIGKQSVVAYFERKAIPEYEDEMYFSQMGKPVRLPKNNGKVLECFVEIPIIDDRNINDQGINAEGVKIENGNLYGSSRDIARVRDSMPLVSEHGGRVNRVGAVRAMISSTIHNFGIFLEFTESAVDFDSRADFISWATSKMIKAANKVHEDQIQLELLAAAGIRKYAGAAIADGDMNETNTVTYEDIAALAIDLDKTHTPRNTRILGGSTNTDTRTINASRIMFIGTELQSDLRRMKDYHDDAAFIGVEKYASQGSPVRGEIGAVDSFRIVSINNMLHWAGAGAAVTEDKRIYSTGGKADIFPMLCVGDDAFDVISFKTDGKNTRFRMRVHEGGTFVDRADPFGKIGFMAIQWWHGVLIKRPERIALLKTTAKR